MNESQALSAINNIDHTIAERGVPYDEIRRCYAGFLLFLINVKQVVERPSAQLQTVTQSLEYLAKIRQVDSDDALITELVSKLWAIEKGCRTSSVETSSLARFAIHCAASEQEWLEMDLGEPTPIWTYFSSLRKICPDVGQEFTTFFCDFFKIG